MSLRRLFAALSAAVGGSRRRRVITAVSGTAAVGLTVGLLVALPGSPPPPAKPVAHLAVAPPKPAPKKPRPRPPLTSPFTGEPIKKLGPVLVAKIDNIVYARPQTGLQSADIVYVLPVEGGLSRFEAVFSSHVPTVIGPVRSAREDDLELLKQFGRPAFAFSGAAPHLLPFIERARIVDLYAGIVGGYYRDDNRIAPYNLFANTKTLLSEARGASKARDIGFRFGPAPAGGRAATSYSVSYPAAAYTFRWSAKAQAVARVDGRRPGHGHRGRAAWRPDRRHPVHGHQDVAVPRVRKAPAVRAERRFRPGDRAARRAGVHRALVAPEPQRRHHVHPAVGPADDVRARPGLGSFRGRLAAIIGVRFGACPGKRF